MVTALQLVCLMANHRYASLGSTPPRIRWNPRASAALTLLQGAPYGTRARVSQITKLIDLAPDIQETILFLPPSTLLREKNLRRITGTVCWREQRRLFQELALSEAHK